MAEGVGFEPTRERKPPGGFQDRCLKPLGHPSSVMSNRRRRLISPIEAAYSRRMRRVEQGCTSRSDDVVVVVSARTASDGCVSRMPCKACRDVKLRGRLPAKLRNGTHPGASSHDARRTCDHLRRVPEQAT